MQRAWGMAGLAALLSGLAACGGGEAPFDRYDLNRDGVITRDEARAHPELLEQFESLDRNLNGRVTPEEFAAYRGG